MARGRSAMRAILSGLPLSSDSSCANSSVCFSIRSARRHIMRPRSEGEIFDHGPVAKAARAAFTARSISSRSPSATFERTSPVAGFVGGEGFAGSGVDPLAVDEHLLLFAYE